MAKELTPDSLGKETRKIVDFYLAHPTMKQKDIAKALGTRDSWVSIVLNNPRVHAVYPLIMRKKMQSDMLPQAYAAYERLLTKGQNEAVIEKAASKVMQEKKVFDAPMVTVKHELTLSDVRALQEKVQKAANLPENAIDAELVEPPTTPDTTQDIQNNA